ncbi:mitochondrial carrier domain-containing protein, partial [Phlyctochytrium arcticum]
IDQGKSIISGALAGGATVVAGHPFDTIKVRLQTHPLNSNLSMTQCLRNTIKTHGVKGLYKGMGSPLVGVMPRYAARFWAYDTACQGMNSLYPGFVPSNDLSKCAVAGGLAAIPTSIVTVPTEQIKVLMQTQDHRSGPAGGMLGSVPIRTLYDTGGIRALYRGTGATLLRDIPGFAAYFVAYELVHRVVSGSPVVKEGEESIPMSNTSIGIAGEHITDVANCCQPPDVIKSRIQAAPPGTYRGMTNAALQIIHKEGVRALFRGTAPLLLRLIPANAAGFFGRLASLEIMNRMW